jgi:putative SOS response-associated peptidase YedK
MCGRYVFTSTAEAMLKLFGLTMDQPPPDRYNIAPGQYCLAVRAGEGGAEPASLRWGLVPHWAKDPAIAYRMINARSETAAEKPAFREALARRRCLIPASAFYEWQGEKPPKQPYAIYPEDHGPFAFAGVWERWGDPEQPLETFSILTRAADEGIAWLHHRMPVVMAPERFEVWLGGPADAAADLLHAPTPFAWATHPVSTRINGARAEGADLLEPAPLQPQQGSLF